MVIVTCGQIVGRRKSWTRRDALSWSFITALTVGYGAFVPLRKISRCLSVLVAFCGIIVTGIVVAITIKATTEAFEQPGDFIQLEQKIEESGKARPHSLKRSKSPAVCREVGIVRSTARTYLLA